jgi:hypothetical protein
MQYEGPARHPWCVHAPSCGLIRIVYADPVCAPVYPPTHTHAHTHTHTHARTHTHTLSLSLCALDRSSIVWADVGAWPRRTARWGDFDLEGISVDDAHMTILQPNFRPFYMTVYNFQAPRLREVRVVRAIPLSLGGRQSMLLRPIHPHTHTHTLIRPRVCMAARSNGCFTTSWPPITFPACMTGASSRCDHPSAFSQTRRSASSSGHAWCATPVLYASPPLYLSLPFSGAYVCDDYLCVPDATVSLCLCYTWIGWGCRCMPRCQACRSTTSTTTRTARLAG